MSDFLNSPIINDEVSQIIKLQERIIFETFHYVQLSTEQKIEHIHNLEILLEKQRIFYTRLKLSEDPDAKFLLTRLIDSAKMSGFLPSGNMNDAFAQFEKKIENMKASLDIKD